MKMLICLIILLNSISGYSRKKSLSYHQNIQKTEQKIAVDGFLNERVWEETESFQDFWQHFPVDTINALSPTLVKMVYDDEYLYIGIICKMVGQKPIIQNLIRDHEDFWNSDAVSIAIDPLNSNTAGYFFGLNAGGSKHDGFISQQGFTVNLDMYWDNVWDGKTSIHADEYQYEFAIPFSIIKYQKNITTWGINFIRNDMNRVAFDIWTMFPARYNGLDFLYNGSIFFTEGLPDVSKKKLEIKPSITTKYEETNESPWNRNIKVDGGLDAKYVLTENLNIDIALLPDFSAVEVDKQYIDFYRFEYKNPEQRTFFLENSDLFSSLGSDDDYNLIPSDAYHIKPFYSRRIGINEGEYTPILYGTRLSGSIDNSLRIGLLNLQTQKNEMEQMQNYTATSFRKAKNNFVFAGLLLNRQTIGINEENIEYQNNKFNRNVGFEMDFTSSGNSIASSLMYYKSFNPEELKNTNYIGAEFEYQTPKLRTKYVFYHVDKNYISDLGFIPRLYHYNAILDTVVRIGYTEMTNSSKLMFFPGTKIQSIRFNSRTSLIFHSANKLNELKQQFTYALEFENRSNLITGLNYSIFDLLYPNDILKNGFILPTNRYRDLTFNLQYISSVRNPLIINTLGEYGIFYNGKKIFTDTKIIYKIQPWSVFTLSYNLCRIDLYQYQITETYHLIGFRSEINFSRDISWTTLLQYNTQIKNINMNSLFRWRFRPQSDFYFVIKDELDTYLEQKKIQFILKLNYWFKI